MKAYVLVVLAALALVCAGAGAAGQPIPRCARGFSGHAHAGLPAPVLLQTRCARFLVQTDGSVAALPLPSPRPWYGGSPLGEGTWLRHKDGHLLVFRDGRTLWRSHARYDLSGRHGAWGILGPGALAFVYDHTLYMSPLDGPERLIAAGEYPVAWSPHGDLYTFAGQRHQDKLQLRAPSGRLLGTIAAGVGEYEFEQQTGTELYRHDGALFRANGLRSRELTRIPHESGFDEYPGGLIGIDTRHRTAVLDHHGRVLAVVRMNYPWVTPAPDKRQIAFTGAHSIYVMNVRTKMLGRVYRGATLQGCGNELNLAWRGSWLLINAFADGRVVAVNTVGGQRIDLTRLVRSLPGSKVWEAGDTGLQVSWS